MTGDTRKGVVGLVLAGGEGRRLGGVDKGLVLWRGHAMAELVCHALGAVVPDVMISANRSLEVYSRLVKEVLEDPEETRWQGPLAGLLAAMSRARELGYEAVLVSPCDTPDVVPALFERLLEAHRKAPGEVVLALLNDRLQPLHGIYPVKFAPVLAEYLASGGRKVREFAGSLPVRQVDCDEFADNFANRNRVEDFPGNGFSSTQA